MDENYEQIAKHNTDSVLVTNFYTIFLLKYNNKV